MTRMFRVEALGGIQVTFAWNGCDRIVDLRSFCQLRLAAESLKLIRDVWVPGANSNRTCDVFDQ
jgi:hypothetical protein